MSASHRCLSRRIPLRLSRLLLLLAACPYLPLHATTPSQDKGSSSSPTTTTETFPLRRPVQSIREAALQTVGRDGPRYPDDGFLSIVRKHRTIHTTTTSTTTAATPDDVSDHPHSEHCSGGFTVLTVANQLVMETLTPLLLESLHRIQLPASASASAAAAPHSSNLARHTLVIGVTPEALQVCIRLRRRYKNACLSDSLSGLHEGDNRYPSFTFLSYGMAKLKYIVNVLSTGTAVLYLDADVVLLRNPFPDLLGSNADIAVAIAPAPCGTKPRKPDWALLDGGEDADRHADRRADLTTHGSDGGVEQQQQRAQDEGQGQNQQEGRRRVLQDDERGGDDGAVMGYAPGITFYRSTPGVMRCTYSLLLDMLNVALKVNATNVTVLEQDHFAGFMPVCAEALGLELAELPQRQYLTAACGGGAAADAVVAAARSGSGDADAAVAVHVSGGVLGSPQGERLPLMQSLLGVTLAELMREADNETETGETAPGEDGGGGTEAIQAAVISASEFVQV